MAAWWTRGDMRGATCLHGSCRHDQLIVLQGGHLYMPPKIVAIGMFAGFPVKTIVKTSIERFHKSGSEKGAWKLMAVRLGRAQIEVKVIVHVAESELNISVEPTVFEPVPVHRIEWCAEVQ